MMKDKKVLKKWIALEKAKMVYENDIEYESYQYEYDEYREIGTTKNAHFARIGFFRNKEQHQVCCRS